MNNVIRHEHDPEKDFGWEITISRRGQYFRKYFSDARYGGKAGALEAAVLYRDELLARLPAPLPIKIRNARNTSGAVGITVMTKPRKGWNATYIVARWPGNGSAAFSADKIGFEEAWRQALAARQQAIAASARALSVRARTATTVAPLAESLSRFMDKSIRSQPGQPLRWKSQRQTPTLRQNQCVSLAPMKGKTGSGWSFPSSPLNASVRILHAFS